jgi:hypothetical protein
MTAREDIVTGGCLCGSVRYQTAMPVSPPAFCHCASCRRASGADAMAWDRPADGLPQHAGLRPRRAS